MVRHEGQEAGGARDGERARRQEGRVRVRLGSGWSLGEVRLGVRL